MVKKGEKKLSRKVKVYDMLVTVYNLEKNAIENINEEIFSEKEDIEKRINSGLKYKYIKHEILGIREFFCETSLKEFFNISDKHLAEEN